MLVVLRTGGEMLSTFNDVQRSLVHVLDAIDIRQYALSALPATQREDPQLMAAYLTRFVLGFLATMASQARIPQL